MSVDLRLRHDRSLRERAVGMFERGLGYKSAARELGVPAEAVRNWQKTYRATGRDGLLAMGGGQARYDYETRVAAASAVVDGGMSKPEAMERFGVASLSPLKQWCRLYRGGGAEALGPRPKGRPRGSGAKTAPRTREQELGGRVRKLEAQVAYLKKSIALKAELRSRSGRRPWRSPSSRGWATGRPTCWRPPAWRGRATAARSRAPRRRPGPSSGRASPRSSAGSRTASATARSPWS